MSRTWIVLIAIVAATGIASIFTVFNGARHDPVHDALNTAAIGLRSSLPERLDEMSELVGVSVEDDTITYQVKLADALPEASIEQIKKNIQAVHQKRTCADPGLSAVVKAGGTSELTYIFKGNAIVTARVSSCP